MNKGMETLDCRQESMSFESISHRAGSSIPTSSFPYSCTSPVVRDPKRLTIKELSTFDV